MKKTLSVILGILMALGALSGCSKTVTEIKKSEKEYGAYSHVWTASDTAVEHGVGDLAIDDGWGSVATDKPGVLCSVSTATLHETAYTAAARLLVDEQTTSDYVACVLRVLDADNTELGRYNVHMNEFENKLTYQDFTFTFPVEKETEARFEIYWSGTNYVRVSEFGIMSKTKEDLPDAETTGAALLGVAAAQTDKIGYSESALYYFDLYSYMTEHAADAEESYDIANLVCTLQGLVNRDGKRLFVRFQQANGFSESTDDYWLNYYTADGGFLSDKTVVKVSSPMTLLTLFDKYYDGFAAWDPEVPATVNAVATACGVDNLLPVRYSTVRNSLYYYLTVADDFSEKPIKINLGGAFVKDAEKIYGTEEPSTGSRKNDVYLWAKINYLDTHKTNSHLMAYHVDAYGSNTVFAAYADLQNMYLSNRDYYIANKAFFFDLSPMEFEIPDDDPDQQEIDTTSGTTDYATFTSIMKAQASYAEETDAETPIDIGGFTPWHLKYTKYTNQLASGEVTCEWETVYQFSIYNAYINADAPSYTAMANASIYAQFPMKDSYTQSGKAVAGVTETLPSENERGVNYLMFFMGDFDASAWLNTAMIKLWNDENRGKIPLCWPFSLNISKRAGHVIDWMYETATENDYFVAGDNGVGYLNPEAMSDSRHDGIYGSLVSWAAYNKKIYRKFGIDYTGFLITRKPASREILECYATFCKGAATNWSYTGDSVENFGTTPSIDYISSTVADLVKNFSAKEVGSESAFCQVRFVLRTPTDVLAVYEQVTSEKYADYNFKVVDPYTFYTLQARQNAKK